MGQLLVTAPDQSAACTFDVLDTCPISTQGKRYKGSKDEAGIARQMARSVSSFSDVWDMLARFI